MAGKKTHEQQLRIIEERVNTKNAGKTSTPRRSSSARNRNAMPIVGARSCGTKAWN